MFVTPVAYSSKVISPKWQIVYSLNPMAGVVNGFRWALLGTPTGTQFATACFGGRFSDCPRDRFILLPLHGADVCGHDLT